MGYRIAVEGDHFETMAGKGEAADLGGTAIDDMKENAFAAPDTHGVPESELAAVDGEDPVADLEALFHAARERGAHCGFATCLQLRVGAGGCEEIHGHVASLAEEWLEFLECQEN